jgi:NADPH:quinone reductase-like Zn-dependent oxidoreductase
VATTCSPSNFDYVKSLGADSVFDYRSPTVVDDIKAWSHDADALTLAWDCISSAESARLCAAALSKTRQGHYRSLLKVEDEVVQSVNDKVSNGLRVAYTMFGEPFEWHGITPAIPEDYEYGKMFWELARELLAQGKIKPARADVNRGGKGLEGVLVGLSEMKQGKVSGVKLVYTF